MKITAHLAAFCMALVLAQATPAAELLKYKAKAGSKMRIEGSSTIHDWSAESVFVGGRLELDPSFPTDPASKELKPGKIEANGTVAILVYSFKCSSGSAMDAVMQETMDAKNFQKIEFKLKDLVFKEFTDDSLLFDATGDLSIHGKTKTIDFPVKIARIDAKTLKITGTTMAKMSDYGIQPPAPKIALGAIKTIDDIKLIFDWNVERVAGATGS